MRKTIDLVAYSQDDPLDDGFVPQVVTIPLGASGGDDQKTKDDSSDAAEAGGELLYIADGADYVEADDSDEFNANLMALQASGVMGFGWESEDEDEGPVTPLDDIDEVLYFYERLDHLAKSYPSVYKQFWSKLPADTQGRFKRALVTCQKDQKGYLRRKAEVAAHRKQRLLKVQRILQKAGIMK